MARVLEKLGGFKGKTIVVYSETGEPIGEYRLIEKYPTQSVQTVEKLIVLQDIDEYSNSGDKRNKSLGQTTIVSSESGLSKDDKMQIDRCQQQQQQQRNQSE